MKHTAFKKLTAAVLALTLLAALLAGCTTGSPKGENETVYRTVDQIKESGTIHIGVFSDKSPFGYVDENGAYQGYDVYFAERIGKDLGVKIDYVSTEAANRIEHDTKYGGYPAYGQLDTKTGFTVNTSYLLFYSDLILGDLYLLRGRGVAGESSSDYVKAASYYYHFLKERAQDKGHVVTSTRASITKHEEQGTDIYSYTGNADSWMNLFANTSSLQANENITVIPSSANGQSGHKILSQAAQIYGFDMTSTISGGQVSVGLYGNLRSRQVEPSEAYLQLSAAQNYANVDKYSDTGNDLEWEYYEGAGDARIYATAPTYRVTNGTGNERFIMKDAPKGKFKFYKSVYRLRQVYLRYAEAINRAGYPRLAFAVLRNGLAKKKFPKGLLAEVDVNSIDTENKTFKYIYSLDSCEQNNAINYIGVDELRRMEKDPMYATYLDFGYAASTGDYWTNNGIHEAGCGLSTVEDSL